MNEFPPGDWPTHLDAVTEAIWSASAAHDRRHLVYGYLRVTTPRPHYITALRRTLSRYCWAHNLRVGGAFIDQGVADDQLHRPGFAGLCQVLQRPDSFAALVVHQRHLSGDPQILALLTEQIWITGAGLLCIRGATPSIEQPHTRANGP